VRGTGGKTGVLGETSIGDGVLGEGVNGVHGRSKSPTDSGVYGENTGGGTGVAGLTNGATGPNGIVAGVWGVNQGPGAGVRGTGGLGGVFEGSIAPLQLVSSQIPGHPTSGQHSMGELYVDVQGVLWFCIATFRRKNSGPNPLI
jgi:hypothetical protein